MLQIRKDAQSALCAMSHVPHLPELTKRSCTFLLSELWSRLHELDHPVHVKRAELHIRARSTRPHHCA